MSKYVRHPKHAVILQILKSRIYVLVEQDEACEWRMIKLQSNYHPLIKNHEGSSCTRTRRKGIIKGVE
jgi:hypothetical protein